MVYMGSAEDDKRKFIDGMDKRDIFIEEINTNSSKYNEIQRIGASIVKYTEQSISSQTPIDYSYLFGLFPSME